MVPVVKVIKCVVHNQTVLLCWLVESQLTAVYYLLHAWERQQTPCSTSIRRFLFMLVSEEAVA